MHSVCRPISQSVYKSDGNDWATRVDVVQGLGWAGRRAGEGQHAAQTGLSLRV